MITKGVLFPQNNVPVHSSVVAKAPVVFGSPMGPVLMNMVGAELVRSHSPDWLPWQPLVNALEHCSGETRHLFYHS